MVAPASGVPGASRRPLLNVHDPDMPLTTPTCLSRPRHASHDPDMPLTTPTCLSRPGHPSDPGPDLQSHAAEDWAFRKRPATVATEAFEAALARWAEAALVGIFPERGDDAPRPIALGSLPQGSQRRVASAGRHIAEARRRTATLVPRLLLRTRGLLTH